MDDSILSAESDFDLPITAVDILLASARVEADRSRGLVGYIDGRLLESASNRVLLSGANARAIAEDAKALFSSADAPDKVSKPTESTPTPIVRVSPMSEPMGEKIYRFLVAFSIILAPILVVVIVFVFHLVTGLAAILTTAIILSIPMLIIFVKWVVESLESKHARQERERLIRLRHDARIRADKSLTSTDHSAADE